MSNLPEIAIGIVILIIGFFILKTIAGLILKTVVFGAIVVFLYYLYSTGFAERIMAPGAPISEVISTII